MPEGEGNRAFAEFLGHLKAGLKSQASDLETAFAGKGAEVVLAFGFGAGWQAALDRKGGRDA